VPTSPKTPFWKSIRTKLVIVTIAVEVTMLGLLLANSLRLLNQTLQDQTNARLEAVTPLLNASLSTRLFERDHAAIREILTQLLKSKLADFKYIVVYDNRHDVYAQAGDVSVEQMPPVDSDVSSSLNDFVFDASAPLTVSGVRVGSIRFGLSLAALAASRDTILHQSTLIAITEVSLSFILLTLAGYLLTRHISRLVTATQKIAGGDYDIHIATTTKDEIGLLGDNFNAMSKAVRERVEALRKSEQMLYEEKERAEVTLHSIGDGVITTDVGGHVLYLNPIAERLTGRTLGSVRGQPIEKVYHVLDEQTGSPLANPVRLCLAENNVVSGLSRAQLLSEDGQIHSIEETASPIRDKDGRTIGAVLVVRDVTTSREISRQLEYQASHDTLTGLFNRRQFEWHAERALEDARHEGITHAICYMDLDQFKVVNDTCGHYAGDRLLVELAKLIKTKTREKDVVGRLGGDEFGVLLHDVTLDQAAFYAAEIRNSIRDYRYAFENHVFQVGVSIGVVPLGGDTGSLADAFSAADVACYVAKDKGRNQIYVSRLNDVEQARRQLEMQWSARIPLALKEDRFVLHHQQILPLSDDPALAPRCELLVRMVDNDGTLIPPNKLIPAAERFRHMADLDRWIIHHALELIAGRHATQGFRSYAINLSGQSLGQADLLGYVKREILRSGVDPQLITFEITETAAIHNVALAAQFMADLKRMGCQFALDDFGSGLSSFGYLKMLPVDYLKIDGSFVRNMLRDSHDHSIVIAITQIAKTLGIRCVAEFIEDHDTLIALKEIGVDYGQGFYLHRPEALPGFGVSSEIPRAR
jgi:diguanylate cyclase (GGDEF)-like protein/PAS domain S-box-containing protein